ncbi:MAG: substrate-binding domain-containing protein [Candidatus Hydrogenedentes bacterium]|nr:substrate-binding domain-containing protein [Candidatus Hydrogenedentota bacterium]
MRRKAGLAIVTLMVAVVAGVFAGCSGGDGGAQTAAQQPAAPKIKLAGIVFQEDQFFRLVLFGMRDAAKKAGVELLEGNSMNKPEKEIELINAYIARKVDAILISPLSAKGSITALKLASDKGIKIIAHNTPIESDVPAAYIECSADDLGAQTGKVARKYVEEKLGGNAKLAVIEFKSLVPEQSDARVNGFKRQLEGLTGVQVVAEQDAWLPEQAVKRVGDILTAQPDINIIYAANEGGTIGAVMAVKNAGKAGQVVVFGTDSSEQLLSFLRSDDNILQCTTSQRPAEVGAMAVEFALKVLKGEPVQPHVQMTGICLRRDDPAGLAAFEQTLKQWMGRGNP